jgi:hypothetical protein
MPPDRSATQNRRTNRTHVCGADERPSETDCEDVPAAGRLLVVLNSDAPATSLWAAFQHLDASDGALDLLIVYQMERFETHRNELLKAGATAPYTVSDLEAAARQVAGRVGHNWLTPLGVPFEAIGAVGHVRDCVRWVAEERGSTRVYFEVPRRTLWQRLRGGLDRATALDDALSTDVTVVSVGGTVESGGEAFDAVPDAAGSAAGADTHAPSIET